MKSRAGDRFRFTPELGLRLRGFRVRVGLTQQKVAVAMGIQSKGNHKVVWRLERGKMKNPGIGLIADYLRACRAGFADILDILDSYTAKTTVIEIETQQILARVREHLPAKIERAVHNYDVGVVTRAEVRHEPVPEPKEPEVELRKNSLR